MESNTRELTDEEIAQFDWITLHKEMDEKIPIEGFRQKLARKCSENPFVPIGALATIVALSYGLWTFRTGDRKMSQYMMRTRVVAQGFTIMAMVAGIGIAAQKVNEKKKFQ